MTNVLHCIICLSVCRTYPVEFSPQLSCVGLWWIDNKTYDHDHQISIHHIIWSTRHEFKVLKFFTGIHTCIAWWLYTMITLMHAFYAEVSQQIHCQAYPLPIDIQLKFIIIHVWLLSAKVTTEFSFRWFSWDETLLCADQHIFAYWLIIGYTLQIYWFEVISQDSVLKTSHDRQLIPSDLISLGVRTKRTFL